jgi:hypothetical protein
LLQGGPCCPPPPPAAPILQVHPVAVRAHLLRSSAAAGPQARHPAWTCSSKQHSTGSQPAAQPASQRLAAHPAQRRPPLQAARRRVGLGAPGPARAWRRQLLRVQTGQHGQGGEALWQQGRLVPAPAPPACGAGTAALSPPSHPPPLKNPHPFLRCSPRQPLRQAWVAPRPASPAQAAGGGPHQSRSGARSSVGSARSKRAWQPCGPVRVRPLRRRCDGCSCCCDASAAAHR